MVAKALQNYSHIENLKPKNVTRQACGRSEYGDVCGAAGKIFSGIMPRRTHREKMAKCGKADLDS